MTENASGNIGDGLIGKEIDGCVIEKKIGQGGMGVVFLAQHRALKQPYVVKILNPALTAAEDTIQRFFREAKSVARLKHPSIVEVQSVGQQGDYYFIRMEYVDGDTVENVIKLEKKLDWKLASQIMVQTAEALTHAHKKGIIHRDIKPENIMLTKDGQVKVMDFGLAKQVQGETKVSITGQIVGTPFFMSPEQAGGKTTDARSDIYSLGVTYYYLLTGVKPFNGKNLQEIFLKHFFYTPESPKIYNPQLPEACCEIIRRCLKKKKKERYQSAATLARDLRVVLGEEQGELSPDPATASDSTSGASSPDLAPSPSSEDFQKGGETQRASIKKPSGSSSDIGAPAPGQGDDAGAFPEAMMARASGGESVDRVEKDLAQARRELGGGGGTVVAPQSNDGEAAVSAAPAAQADDAGEPSAPLVKRAGRTSLEQIAAASLVFTAGGKPPEAPVDPLAEAAPAALGSAGLGSAASGSAVRAPEEAPSAPLLKRADRVSLDKVAAASLVFQQNRPATAPSKAAVAEKATAPAAEGPTAFPQIKLDKKETPAGARPQARSKKRLVLGVGAVLLLLAGGAGGYEMVARGKFAPLDAEYAGLEKAGIPAGGDADAIKKTAASYTDLATRLQAFADGYGFSLEAGKATDEAGTLRTQSALAQKATSGAKSTTGNGNGSGGTSATDDPRKRLEHDLEQALADETGLEKQGRLAEAGDRAMKALDLARQLGGGAEKRVLLPLEVSSEPAGASVVEIQPSGADGAVLGKTLPEGAGKLVVHAPAGGTVNLELRLAHFVPEPVKEEVKGYRSLMRRLRREVKRHFPIGRTKPLAIGVNPAQKIPLLVDNAFAVDPSGQGRLFMISRDGMLRCIDKNQAGAPCWPDSVQVGEFGDTEPAPCVVPGAAVVAASGDGRVDIYGFDSGKPFWPQPVDLGSQILVTPQVSPSRSEVIVATVDGQIVCLAAGTGAELWRKQLDGKVLTPPLVQGERVFAASSDGRLVVLALNDGHLLATYDANDDVTSGPVVCGSLVYLGTATGHLHAVDVREIKPVLVAAYVAEPLASPVSILVATADTIYYASKDELRAVSAGLAPDFQGFKPFPSPNPIAGVAPMHDHVAVVTQTGFVTSLDAKGTILWTFNLSTPAGPVEVMAPPVVADEELLVMTRCDRDLWKPTAREGELVVLPAD